jgi:hypothetical protein
LCSVELIVGQLLEEKKKKKDKKNKKKVSFVSGTVRLHGLSKKF